MAATTVPKALVYQEFTVVPSAVTQPMRACVVGPLAHLNRYAVADEKALIGLGEYDPLADHNHGWPGRRAGYKVDLSSVKLFIDNARLLYYRHATGDGKTVTVVPGKKDQVKISGSTGFKANGSLHLRLTELGDRDVKVGDDVKIRILDVDNNPVTISTYVKSVLATKSAAVVAAAEADDGNATTQSAAAVVSRTAGTDNSVKLAAILTNYNAWPDGYLTDTYTVEVISGSVDGDLSTALIRITTASGQDDVASMSPSLVDHGFVVGRRGLTLKFWSASGSSSVAVDDLHYGDKWTIAVTDNYTTVVGTAAGTFTGDQDETYIVTCVRGGLYNATSADDRPQIVCTTTRGTDVSGPTTVSSWATGIACGTKGVTIAFSGIGNGIRKGDRWYISTTAPVNGNFNILQLGRNLPDNVLTAIDCDMDLSIRKDVEVSQERYEADPLTNWEASATEFTTIAGATATDDSYTISGVLTALPIDSGSMYVEYRAWRTDLVGTLLSVPDPGSLDSVLPGPLDPSNPLKWGVYMAQINAGGAAVYCTVVADPTELNAWSDALGILAGHSGFHGVVPLSTDRAVIDLFVAHVKSRSTAERSQWRVAWVPLTLKTSNQVVSAAQASDGEPVLATIADDPNTSGTQYTIVSVPTPRVDFEELGVAAGDEVRCLYSTAFGVETYSAFLVDAVLNGNTIRLLTGPNAAVSVASKIEIWHPMTKDEQADDLVSQAASYGSSRVRAVWPDGFTLGGVEVGAEFVPCLPAGLRSGVVPQQGLTNVELTGPDSLPRSLGYFSQEQLERMALGGVWVLRQTTDGSISTLMATTTAIDNANTREEMIVANVDSISYFMFDWMSPYVGRANATETMVAVLYNEAKAALSYLASNGATPSLGGQVGPNAAVLDCRRHAVLRDRIVLVINPDVPSPLNNPEVHLVIG